MQLNKLFLIKPDNKLAKLWISYDSRTPSVHLSCSNRQLIYSLHNSEFINEFYHGIHQEWVDFEMNRPKEFIISDVYDEYPLHLN